MNMKLPFVLAAATVSLFALAACAGSEPPPAQAPTSTSTNAAPTAGTTSAPASEAPTPAVDPGPASSGGAKEGEACGDGVMGRPNIACATGLVCDSKNAAGAPPGAQGSAPIGRCRKP